MQQQLARFASAYGAEGARISAFPTFMMVSMGRGEPAALEITTSFGTAPGLDQIAALDRLVRQAERGEVPPTEGIERLDEIANMTARYAVMPTILGYSAFTMGLCLILQPAVRDVAAAAVLGALVGLLRWLVRRPSPMQVVLPVLTAFLVSALSALAAEQDLTGPGLRAMVASLVVFLPGAALTTAVLELAAGQAVSGASRLVAGIVQLALLAFGIVAGIEAVGVPFAVMLRGSGEELGAWAPWVGVLVFAIGVVVANSAPGRSFPSLLIVLYVAWTGQVVGNVLLGASLSAFVGALVMTPVATWVSRLPHALPPHVSFLPGFWLLVPGALGLIGLTQVAGDAGSAGVQELGVTVASIFAVAVGVLCGTLLLGWATATGRAIGGLSDATATRGRVVVPAASVRPAPLTRA